MFLLVIDETRPAGGVTSKARWMLGGVVSGAVLASLSAWPEVLRRLAWRGGGERADWGEPAFYGAVLGLAGAIVGAALGALMSRLTRRSD